MHRNLSEYLKLQIEEALGPINKWYASEKAGYEIKDKEILFRHYVQFGGAFNFSIRYKECKNENF